MCESSDIDEQRGHKVVPVMSIEFDFSSRLVCSVFRCENKTRKIKMFYPHVRETFIPNILFGETLDR